MRRDLLKHIQFVQHIYISCIHIHNTFYSCFFFVDRLKDLSYDNKNILEQLYEKKTIYKKEKKLTVMSHPLFSFYAACSEDKEIMD